MNQKKLVILEDSSLRSFGGGQKISLLITKIFLKKSFKVEVYDTCKDSEFCQKLQNKVILKSYNNIINNFGKSNIFKNNFKALIWVLSILTFLKNYKKSNNSYVLATTKKTYILILLLKLIYGKRFQKGDLIIYYHMCNQYVLFEQIYYFLISVLESITNLIHSKKFEILHLYVSKCARDSFNNFNLLKNKYNTIIYNPAIEENILKNLRDDYNIVLETNPKKLVIISSLNKFKGVFEFVEIFKSLSFKNLCDFELHIYGYGEEENKIKKVSQNKSNIHFHGKINSPFKALKDAYCVILPSIISEACPLVAIESICAGRPCFSRNFGGQKELLKDSNKYIDNSTSYKLIESILNLEKKYLLEISTLFSKKYETNFSQKIYSYNMQKLIN